MTSQKRITDASALVTWRKSSYSSGEGGACLEVAEASELAAWRKSSYSNAESASCLEVSDGHPAAVPVRDSKNPAGPALVFEARAWQVFVDEVKRA
ncbi:DUF397 domain-containing protein [Streptomyces ficellus]|uniref:DUF397 domain-containing protein n=1 Tax=Streptomyces ficellus TaxID=1977088 RepID=A0ABT7ZC03_9ACTN|nr:DUF397 domain-containing protein [Streptomyces ficellus]MDN3297035.1 DUF397 domain-containing protein [Streptomyces ficellus]